MCPSRSAQCESWTLCCAVPAAHCPLQTRGRAEMAVSAASTVSTCWTVLAAVLQTETVSAGATGLACLAAEQTVVITDTESPQCPAETQSSG